MHELSSIWDYAEISLFSVAEKKKHFFLTNMANLSYIYKIPPTPTAHPAAHPNKPNPKL